MFHRSLWRKVGDVVAIYPDFVEKCGYGHVQGIGGANCRHSFYPYIEGISERTYTDSELEAMKPENRPKIQFEGREYDDYQATQMQRRVEREIRKQKRLKAAYEAAGLEDESKSANIRLRRLNEKYRRFSQAAGLPEQRDRTRVLHMDDASKAKAADVKVRRSAEEPIRKAIKRGDYPLTINPEKQARHMLGAAIPGRSVITVSMEELQSIINQKAGGGKLDLTDSFIWNKREIIDVGKEIGYTINVKGDIITTRSIKIHYSKTGVHAVPFSGRWRK